MSKTKEFEMTPPNQCGFAGVRNITIHVLCSDNFMLRNMEVRAVSDGKFVFFVFLLHFFIRLSYSVFHLIILVHSTCINILIQ